jgi:hypothetical protein
MWAARVVCWGFDLGAHTGFDVLDEHYNPVCVPEWSESELRRKCDQAMDPDFGHRRGWLLDAEPERRTTSRPDYSSVFSDAPAVAAEPRKVGQGGGDSAAPPNVPAPPGRPAPPSPPAALTTIRNYAIRTGDNGAEIHVGLTPQQITREVLRATGGWPKAMAGRLFVPSDDHSANWLDEPAAFFAWLAGHVGQGGGLIEWGRGTGQIPKAEFFAYLCGAVDQYDDVQSYPHCPPRPATCYLHPQLPAGGSGALDSLLDRLCPATDTDRILIRAFFLTMAWGGKLGGRPIFIWEASTPDGRPGQGAGKSTAAMLAGKLFGGFLGISLATADDMQVQTRLLSPHGRRSRLVVFDNLKGTRVSNSLVESYVTADVISGRELYVGEGTRLNIITWAITANEPSLSKDLVGRAYPIRIIPPQYDPDWTGSVDAFIAAHRWQILGDIVAELQQQPVGTLGAGEWSRWPEWERDVLCRICDPHDVAEAIKDRRDDIDNDTEVAGIVWETLKAYIREKSGFDPETMHLRLTATVLADAVGKLSTKGAGATNVGAWLRTMKIPGLTSLPRANKVRPWIWKGSESLSNEPDDWTYEVKRTVRYRDQEIPE